MTELWRGVHEHRPELIASVCDALLLHIGLSVIGDTRSPTARGAVRTVAVEILDSLADDGWTVTGDSDAGPPTPADLNGNPTGEEIRR